VRKLHWSLIKRLNHLRQDASLVERQGHLWLLDKYNWIDNRLLSGRRYEPEQIQKCVDAISRFDIDRFIDIGANFGYYSILLGSIKNITEVHSIEPLSRNYYQLCGNIFANRLDDKIKPHKIAFGDVEQELTAYYDPRSTGLARLDIESAQRHISVFSAKETVRVIPFDSYFTFKNGRFLVKIDTEGEEFNIITSMKRFMYYNNAFFQIEVSEGNGEKIVKLLLERGYKHCGNEGSDHYFCNMQDKSAHR